VVFFGTPRFAVPSLSALIGAGAPVALVVTQPDREQGRGRRLAPPPVKSVAQAAAIPVFQPSRLRARESMELILAASPECLVVVAYGQLLPPELFAKPPLGAVNVHASLLPAYRGAAPIQRALLAGETVTGVTTMLIDAGMDTGPVFQREIIDIAPEDHFGSLHDRLAQQGATLLLETLTRWKAGQIRPVPQDNRYASYAPPIRKEELRISWAKSAGEVVHQIRAVDPQPGSYCFLRGKRLKCFAAVVLPWKGEGKPGEILGVADGRMVVLAGDLQALGIGALQLEGHRKLAAYDFIRGHSEIRGAVLE
jgi:methionyl-tRNA formyltransferase